MEVNLKVLKIISVAILLPTFWLASYTLIRQWLSAQNDILLYAVPLYLVVMVYISYFFINKLIETVKTVKPKSEVKQ